MGFLNKFFGYRWSVYIVQDPNKLLYALHEHCPITLSGYLLSYFKEGKEPVPPWSLHMNHNRSHISFKLRSYHFQENGERPTKEFYSKIEELDPNWRDRRGSEPVFMVPATKKKLKLSEYSDTSTVESIHEMLSNAGKLKEQTFYSVMDEVFGIAH